MDKPRPRGRPRKAGLPMDTDFRIPLTAEQKAVIDDALADEPGGKAEWARAILLRAARKRISERGRDGGRKPARRGGDEKG